MTPYLGGNFLLHPLQPTHITIGQLENDLWCVIKVFLGWPLYFFQMDISSYRFCLFFKKKKNRDHHMLWLQGVVYGSLNVIGSHNLIVSGTIRMGGFVGVGMTVLQKLSLPGWTLRFPVLRCCQCFNWLPVACKR